MRRRTDKPQAIVLVGPTGSGKTPLGELLEQEGLWGRKCRHFDFGQQLRRIIGLEEGPAYLTPEDMGILRSALRAGALLENEHFQIAEKILRAFIHERERGDDALIVLNGFPRHIGQAQDLGSIVEMEAVIELSCTPEVILERIRTNEGGDREGRRDDTVESIHNRLDVFVNRTAPMVDYYRRQGVRIDNIDVRVCPHPQTVRQALDRAR